MNFFTKTRVLVGAVILLAALNIATLTTIGFHFVRSKNMVPPLPPQELQHTRFMSRELNLDQRQQEELNALRDKFHQENRMLQRDIRHTHRNSMIELSKDNPSTLVFDSLSNEIAKLHRMQFELTIDHFKQLKSVCSPEQQECLQRMFQRMRPFDDFPRERQQYMHAKRRERFKNEEK